MEAKKKMEFKKLSEDKYVFISGTEEIDRRETVNKDYVKGHYKMLLEEKSKLQDALGKINRELEQNKVEKDVELEHFIELANKAASYNKYMQSQAQLEGALKMHEEIDESIKTITSVLPELKRMKK